MPDVEKAWAFLRNSDPVSSAAEVQAAIRRVAIEIESKLAESYPLVLAVMGGAVVFAGQILPLLRFPLDFDYLHASRYGTATAGGGIQWRGLVAPGARGDDRVPGRGHPVGREAEIGPPPTGPGAVSRDLPAGVPLACARPRAPP